MKIYIDFDDVLCETAEYFTKIAKELFDIDVLRMANIHRQLLCLKNL